MADSSEPRYSFAGLVALSVIVISVGTLAITFPMTYLLRHSHGVLFISST